MRFKLGTVISMSELHEEREREGGIRGFVFCFFTVTWTRKMQDRCEKKLAIKLNFFLQFYIYILRYININFFSFSHVHLENENVAFYFILSF